jgi:hypothetical protein
MVDSVSLIVIVRTSKRIQSRIRSSISNSSSSIGKVALKWDQQFVNNTTSSTVIGSSETPKVTLPQTPAVLAEVDISRVQ